ncbi:hypothetical protein CYLTODRAFT_441380 [Cylindrobasidium torrendii FP15055 ss-10]|uniref:Protein kinase domain-containing protein n=1 Tax=Cylindrobasidium torrendii FP15055 ss-10 TaxID=1314674 RepID=A0A0D7BLH3_9AGAR|nr:hypothetical protein CYLTODRAFT_441380 [Cylindrobasidium torrendii FP15055 ss-10]
MISYSSGDVTSYCLRPGPPKDVLLLSHTDNRSAKTKSKAKQRLTESYFHLEANRTSDSTSQTSHDRRHRYKTRRQSTFVDSSSIMSFAPLDTSTPRRSCISLAPSTSHTPLHPSQAERAIRRVHVENLIPYTNEPLKFVTLDPSRRLSRDVYAGIDRVDRSAMRCVFSLKLPRWDYGSRERRARVLNGWRTVARRPIRLPLTQSFLAPVLGVCEDDEGVYAVMAIRPARQNHPALGLQSLFRENDRLREQCDSQITKALFELHDNYIYHGRLTEESILVVPHSSSRRVIFHLAGFSYATRSQTRRPDLEMRDFDALDRILQRRP